MKLKHYCLSLFIMLASLPTFAQQVSVEGYVPYYLSECVERINNKNYSDNDAIYWATILLSGNYKINGSGDNVNPSYFVQKADMSKVSSFTLREFIKTCVNIGLSDMDFSESNIGRLNYGDAMELASFCVDRNAPEKALIFVEQADKYRSKNNVDVNDRIKYSPYAAKAYFATGNAAKGNEIVEQALKQLPDPGKYDAPAMAVIARYLKSQPNANKKLYEKYIGKLSGKLKKLYATDQIWLIGELQAMGKAKDAAKVSEKIAKFNYYSYPENLILAEYFFNQGDKTIAETFIAKAYNKWGNFDPQRVSDYIQLSDKINGESLTVGQLKDVYAALVANDANPQTVDAVGKYLEEKGQKDFLTEQNNLMCERKIREYQNAIDKDKWTLDMALTEYKMLKAYSGTNLDKEEYLNNIKRLLSKAYNAKFEAAMLTKLYNNRELFGDDADAIMTKSIGSYGQSDTLTELLEILMNDESQKDILVWVYPEVAGQFDNPAKRQQEVLEKANEYIGGINSFEQNGIRYSFKGKNLVAEYVGNAAAVTFPATVTYNGTTYKVTAVAGAPGNNSIRTVTISDGIEKVLPYAFKECKNLTTITLGKDCKWYGIGAFGFCPNLSNVIGIDFTDVEGSNAAVKYFLACCYESPKMLDVFYKQMMKKYDADKIEMLASVYILENRYDIDFQIGDKWATLVLAKKFLTTLAAKGNTEAMISICNYFANHKDSKVITAADFLKYARMLTTTKEKAYGYFFMGEAYEFGWGVTPSRTQAHSYYAKGRQLNDPDCDRGFWRTL